jgi:hypothetical protein
MEGAEFSETKFNGATEISDGLAADGLGVKGGRAAGGREVKVINKFQLHTLLQDNILFSIPCYILITLYLNLKKYISNGTTFYITTITEEHCMCR